MDLERYLFLDFDTVKPDYNLPYSLMKALFIVQEKIPAIWWAVMVLCGSRPAKSGFGPTRKSGTATGKVRKRKGNEVRKMAVGRKCRQQNKKNTKLQLILARKTKSYATYLGLGAALRNFGPRYFEPASSFLSTAQCGEE
jgi:hypothetical protein